MRYTGYRDRPAEERQIRFQNGCREGHSELAFTNSGTNLQIVFNLSLGPYHPEREVDFDKEHGKVSERTGQRNVPSPPSVCCWSPLFRSTARRGG